MNQNTIDISKLDKAEVLAALYNNSKQQGMGLLQPRGASGMTKGEASKLIKEQTSFDHLYGRVMKVGIGGDTLDTCGYDRDNGQGAAAAALEPLFKSVQA